MLLQILVLCVLHLSVQGEFIFARHGLPPVEATDRSSPFVLTEWVSQRLDNFNESSPTWKMRYLSNAELFKSGGPIFIMIGGEWEISPGYLTQGLMYELAKKTGAFMVYSEHRFYGLSRPTTDMSIENLIYLTSEQALADLAHLVDYIRENTFLANSKVVVFGGSYSGNLATWFRLKYPKHCDVAHASSGPIFAAVDFYEYNEAVYESFKTHSKSCVDQIANAFDALVEKASTAEGLDQLVKDFNLCTKPARMEDFYVFYQNILNYLNGVIQYARGNDIKNACDELLSVESPYEAIQSIMNRLSLSCLTVDYDEYISELKSVEYSQNIARQWVFQTCNEFGYYQSTTSNLQPYNKTIPIEVDLKVCRDVYGDNFVQSAIESNIRRTNDRYGGLSPNTTRVITVHGKIDPWHRLGLTRSLNVDMPAWLVQTTSHCTDLTMGHTDPVMVAVQQYSMEQIQEWIK